MNIRVKHHLFGRDESRGLSTLSVTAEIIESDLNILESYSLYKLPMSLLYDETKEKPKKYIYYRLNNEDIVIGRGVDAGRDSLGRVGNYLFHNIIFEIGPLEQLNLTPITLIRQFETKAIFCEDAKEKPVSNIDLDIEEYPHNQLYFSDIKSDMISLILYACFNNQDKYAPIWINGETNLLNGFLELLFRILPKRIWWNISFNTSWQDEAILPGLFFCCNDNVSDGIRPSNYSLKIDLAKNIFDSKIVIQDQGLFRYASFIADTALNNHNKLNLIYSLENFVLSNNWDGFILTYKEAAQDIKKVIYDYYKNSILNELARGNVQLFGILEENISNDDRSEVFRQENFINHIIENRDEILAKHFLGWFCKFPSIEDRKYLYTIFQDNQWLLNLLLNQLIGEQMGMNRKIEMIQELMESIGKRITKKESYNELIEERLLEALYWLLDNKSNVDISQTLKMIKKLPASGNPKNLLLRALIRNGFGDSSELVSLIKEEKYRSLISEILNEGIKVINWDKYKDTVFNKEEKKLFGFFK